jgi:CheY-like chemotaxis protein
LSDLCSMATQHWILVVEDDTDLRQLMVEDLERGLGERVKIVQARDGNEAKTRLIYQAFDCIITDLNMPNTGGGRSFIESAKQNPINESTPIIVVTGAPEDDLSKEHNLTVVAKPYESEILLQHVQTQLKLGRLDQRVPAEILNTLIDACKEFLKKIFQSTAELDKPYVKKVGEDLPGQMDCSMQIKTQMGRCTINIGFDQGVVEKLKVAAQAQGLDDEFIINKAMSLVFKYTAQIYQHNVGHLPSLEERQFYKSKSGYEYRLIKDSKGVTIPIRTPFGCIYALALYSTKAKTKTKAQAKAA